MERKSLYIPHNKFWNIVVPVGLVLLTFGCLGLFIATQKLIWCGVALIPAFTFQFIHAAIRRQIDSGNDPGPWTIDLRRN